MPRRRWVLLAVFVVWTAYIWVTRIVNAWGSSTESTNSKVVSTVLSAVMLLLAAGGLVVLVQTWRRPLTAAGARAFQILCGVTVVVWVIRAAQIVASDHNAAFKVVHVVLGIISVVLATLVWRIVAPVAGRGSSRVATAGSSDPGQPLAGVVDGGRG
jgi:fucose 4-O-acetylase-like acetyltransferase